MKKKIYFESGKLTPGHVGAALSGSGQKIDLLAVCKKVNGDDKCIQFPNMQLKLELNLINKQLSHKVVLLTKELINFYKINNTITEENIQDIIKLKKDDFNTNNIDSIRKTLLIYINQIKIEVL